MSPIHHKKILERDSYSALVPDFYFITVTGYSMSEKFVQKWKSWAWQLLRLSSWF